MKPAARKGRPRKNYMKKTAGAEIESNLVNDKPVPKVVAKCTDSNYERQLQNWDDFVELRLENNRTLHIKGELSLEESEIPPSVKKLGDLKEFIYRLGLAMREGMAPEDTLPYTGIRSYWKDFTGGYRRSRGPIPENHITSVTNALHPDGEIGEALNLVPDSGKRKHASETVFTWTGEFLWTLDWKIYARPRPLYLNPFLFYLPIFCATGALRDYKGEDGLMKLLDRKLGPKEERRSIPWDLSVVDKPIFTGAGGRIWTAHDYSKALRETGIRSGFPNPPSQHDYRREGLTNIDEIPNYSDSQRQVFAGQENNAIHQKHYAGTNPGIDGQAAFLRKQVRLENIARHFRELDVEWQPALWQSLPLALFEELTKTSEYMTIKAELQDSLPSKGTKSKDGLRAMSLEVKEESISPEESDCGILHRGVKLRRDCKGLEDKRLKKFWAETSSGAVAGSEGYICRGVSHPFSRLRPILPARRQLADLLPVSTRLRNPDGRDALRAILALYESTSEVNRPGLDQCPCRKNLSQLHVYRCTKNAQPFAEFCFFCNQWLYDSEDWERHCQSHLTQDHLPVEMAYEKIESTFLPGYCPYCLWDKSLPAAIRLHQFCTKDEWESEVKLHGLRWRKETCPDARCVEKFDQEHAFVCHMHDLHRIPKELLVATSGVKREASVLGDIADRNPKRKNAWEDAVFVFDLWSLETNSLYDIGQHTCSASAAGWKWIETNQAATGGFIFEA
ncbi:uncharacterized protein BCR38DRAFT_489986 [Pseudomassariella vexata]|uniref:C2H2-type domain-containing protein n=1 Tax=Pseudomassariella vexata TaxID=1141098 RepID=A0A1Y2DDY9_9PEZI|nr:uncharacterized protein BCR38DRAFT_489986 [Pseudomassariella vexata]ORY57480.1 hypothetical protein BCR38DRAFT_489986 [Pseudomassariella vexata]